MTDTQTREGQKIGEKHSCKHRLTHLAGLAGVSWWTCAVVHVWFRVHAGSPVDTRMMATAVIQI